MNKEGYSHIDEVLSQGTRALSPEEFEVAAEETGAVVLDVRHQNDFVQGFIPSSIFIGIDDNFAPWVGSVIGDVNQPLLLVCPEGREEETVTRLARVGFDKTLGYLKGGIEAWKSAGKEVDAIESIPATEAHQRLNEQKLPVVDVRKYSEYEAEHVEDAKNIPLDYINDKMAEFPKEETFYVHCAGGYRSVIAASILKARGYHNLIDIKGGFHAIKNAGFIVTDYVCPSTLK
jgi:rhodanese-related sulfurtransferase